MGVDVYIEYGVVNVSIKGYSCCLIGVKIYLDYFSVGVMEIIFMVVILVEGEIVIDNVVWELEIVDLVNFCCFMGV